MTVNTKTKVKTQDPNWAVQTEEQHVDGAVQRRRYVRLDITSPIDFKLIVPENDKGENAGFIPFSGEVLNVSAGGVLIESKEAMPEDSYVVMEFELNGSDRISGVVGRIKRCDSETEDCHFVGVEFCTSEDVEQNCPPECQKLLNDECCSFDDKIRRLINRYVFSRKVQEKTGETE